MIKNLLSHMSISPLAQGVKAEILPISITISNPDSRHILKNPGTGNIPVPGSVNYNFKPLLCANR